eukprot:g43356.t1
MEAALAASRAGQHRVLTDFVARNEGNRHCRNTRNPSAAAIANMLKVNKTVINIALASNEIGHAGAKAIERLCRSITC